MRPILNLKLEPKQFLNYYWLKEELVLFCKANCIPVSGDKAELTQRIKFYLETGEITIKTHKRRSKMENSLISSVINLESKISASYKNDEKHREFFRSEIGNHFKFNVTFMKWMKNNIGKTYKEAVNQWYIIAEENKKGIKRKISPQFEYNQYTRDFFKKNPDLSRENCIKCWKYKKSLPGKNRYEPKDLIILME